MHQSLAGKMSQIYRTLFIQSVLSQESEHDPIMFDPIQDQIHKQNKIWPGPDPARPCKVPDF